MNETLDTAYVYLDDLLPAIYPRLFRDSTGRELRTVERDGILIALIDSVKTSLSRCAAARAKANKTSEIVTIKTADHFSGRWISRTEIVQLVESTSGLERRMVDLALLLIEMRTDTALASAGRITVEHIGTFSFYKCSAPQYEHCDPARQYEKLLDTCLSSMLAGSRDVFWSRLFSTAPTHLRVVRDVLELLPTFRALTRYEIELSSELRISSSTSPAAPGDASENLAEP